MGDLGRGLGRAGRDALSTSAERWSAGCDLSGIRGGLPPAYQEALDEVEQGRTEQHFSAGNVALGSFDQLTFGVPLGFYYLVAGTGHGAVRADQGQYEQATRELAPAALLVALYAGGKGVRYLAEARGAGGAHCSPGLDGCVRLRLCGRRRGNWQEAAGRGGPAGAGPVHPRQPGGGPFRRCRRADAALALYEARGNVARARPLCPRPGPGPRAPSRAQAAALAGAPGGLASLVDEAVGPHAGGGGGQARGRRSWSPRARACPRTWRC